MTGSLALTLLAALGAALVLGTLAHRLRMPPMVGYIAAGLLVGPFTPGPVADVEEVEGLAEIGVALLMFSIGLRFRLAELLDAGKLVTIGAPVQVVVSMGLGTLTAIGLGRSPVEALFLGAVISVCSSVVLVKVAGETTLETTLHGRIALSWSIAQDLITVVLVVILSAIVTDSEQPILDALLATGAAALYVVGVLVVGSRLLPAVLRRVAVLGTRELFVVAVAVVAIGTAALAGTVGVSVALGAFVAGMAISESDITASVLGEIVPLRELFSTIFFVSVGILLSPTAVWAALPTVVLLVLLVIVGKGVPVAAIVRAGGHPWSAAARAAGLVAQSGEFSFVLATVGLGLGVLDRTLFSVAMGAVVLSIVLAAPVARLSALLGDALDRRFPARVFAPDEESPAADLRRHVVVVGYGVVGRTVTRVLERRGIPWAAIETDYRRAGDARERGLPVIFGDAGTPAVLDYARIETASTLVIAIPDPVAARQSATYAITRNPRVHIVARAHSLGDEVDLQRIGVHRVISAERQLGSELVRHTLMRYGVSEREIDTILRRRD